MIVCRAAHDGGTHPGKIKTGFQGCIISYGGVEVPINSYEVLVETPNRRPPPVTTGSVSAGSKWQASDGAQVVFQTLSPGWFLVSGGYPDGRTFALPGQWTGTAFAGIYEIRDKTRTLMETGSQILRILPNDLEGPRLTTDGRITNWILTGVK